jgi:hypothetical protein
MRYLPVLLLALAGGVGCGGLDSVRSYGRVPTPPVPREAELQQYIAVDVAFIECPCGDRFLDEELWQLGDEHVDLDVQPILEENGLRVCRMGGLLPARLQALLSSPRTCVQPRRLRADVDKPTAVLVGRRHPHLEIQYRDGTKARDIEVAQAQCLFDITPTTGDDDALRLRFAARVRHGHALLETKVANEPGGELHWSMEKGEPTEELPALTWELPIRPDEFIVIGTRLDRTGTFGQACFLSPEKADRMQTVLVLRASGVQGGAPSDSESKTPKRAPALAAQASLTPHGDRR